MTEQTKHSRPSLMKSLLKRKNPDEMMADAAKGGLEKTLIP